MAYKHAPYCYVSRWYDKDGIPHYFGIYSKYKTLKEARKEIRFNIIAVEPELIYKALDESDMFSYLADVNRNRDNNDEQTGTMDWLNS